MKQYWADAATQNCVWLFQTRKLVITNRGELEYLSKRDLHAMLTDKGVTSLRRHIEAHKDYFNEGLYPEELVETENDVWETERVFLLRKEADAYGRSRPYAWGKKNEGWRIYGVPLAGIAAFELSERGVNQDYIDEQLKDYEG